MTIVNRVRILFGGISVATLVLCGALTTSRPISAHRPQQSTARGTVDGAMTPASIPDDVATILFVRTLIRSATMDAPEADRHFRAYVDYVFSRAEHLRGTHQIPRTTQEYQQSLRVRTMRQDAVRKLALRYVYDVDTLLGVAGDRTLHERFRSELASRFVNDSVSLLGPTYHHRNLRFRCTYS